MRAIKNTNIKNTLHRTYTAISDKKCRGELYFVSFLGKMKCRKIDLIRHKPKKNQKIIDFSLSQMRILSNNSSLFTSLWIS